MQRFGSSRRVYLSNLPVLGLRVYGSDAAHRTGTRRAQVRTGTGTGGGAISVRYTLNLNVYGSSTMWVGTYTGTGYCHLPITGTCTVLRHNRPR